MTTPLADPITELGGYPFLDDGFFAPGRILALVLALRHQEAARLDLAWEIGDPARPDGSASSCSASSTTRSSTPARPSTTPCAARPPSSACPPDLPGSGSGAEGDIYHNRPMLNIGTVVLGAADVRRAADFWRQALRYVFASARQGRLDRAGAGRGPGPALALGLSQTPVQEHPRVHLDLYTEDQAAEVERLVALGAERVDWDLYPDDPDFVVLADTEGNRFCVIDIKHG